LILAKFRHRPPLHVVRHAEHDRLAMMPRDVKRFAHIFMQTLWTMRRDVTRAGNGRERRLVDRLIVPLRVDRHFAGEHD
jgi:hypothetical protein